MAARFTVIDTNHEIVDLAASVRTHAASLAEAGAGVPSQDSCESDGDAVESWAGDNDWKRVGDEEAASEWIVQDTGTRLRLGSAVRKPDGTLAVTLDHVSYTWERLPASARWVSEGSLLWRAAVEPERLVSMYEDELASLLREVLRWRREPVREDALLNELIGLRIVGNTPADKKEWNRRRADALKALRGDPHVKRDRESGTIAWSDEPATAQPKPKPRKKALAADADDLTRVLKRVALTNQRKGAPSDSDALAARVKDTVLTPAQHAWAVAAGLADPDDLDLAPLEPVEDIDAELGDALVHVLAKRQEWDWLVRYALGSKKQSEKVVAVLREAPSERLGPIIAAAIEGKTRTVAIDRPEWTSLTRALQCIGAILSAHPTVGVGEALLRLLSSFGRKSGESLAFVDACAALLKLIDRLGEDLVAEALRGLSSASVRAVLGAASRPELSETLSARLALLSAAATTHPDAVAEETAWRNLSVDGLIDAIERPPLERILLHDPKVRRSITTPLVDRTIRQASIDALLSVTSWPVVLQRLVEPATLLEAINRADPEGSSIIARVAAASTRIAEQDSARALSTMEEAQRQADVDTKAREAHLQQRAEEAEARARELEEALRQSAFDAQHAYQSELRQVEIDVLRGLAALLTELERLKLDGSPGADSAFDVASRHAGRMGLTPVGAPGSIVSYDHGAHRPLGGTLHRGAAVRIVESGWAFMSDNVATPLSLPGVILESSHAEAEGQGT